jgi:copper chaperone CopZ
VSVAIKKIPGVQSVNVSLNKGLVSITLAPGNTVKMEQIRKAILDDAFTPKGAKVVAAGELVSQDEKLLFKVAGTNETFPVASTPHQSWQKDVGHDLTINGLISAPASGAAGGTLQIERVSDLSGIKK